MRPPSVFCDKPHFRKEEEKKIPNERFSILIQQAADFFFVHFTSVTRSSSPAPRAISRNTHELIHSLRLSHISLSLSSSLSTFYMTHSLSDMPVLSFFALLPVSSFSFSPHSLPFLDRQFPGKEEESGVDVTALFVAQCYARFLPPPPPSPSSLSPFP